MVPLQNDSSHAPIARRIQDVLADSSKIREGLRDEDALPLVDWGIARADDLAARLAARPDTNDEQIDQAAHTLQRLMTRVNWVVVYRDKKDEAWLSKMFQLINKLNRDLYGDDAPQLSDAAIAAWLADRSNHESGALIQGLLARLQPGGPAGSAAPPANPATDDDSPPAPFEGFGLPGRAAPSNAPTDTAPSAPHQE